MSTPRASIIISTWNGRHLLETCLPRVLRAVEEAGGDHEVIVVDDASRDDTIAYVRREFPQVRLLALKRNLRFAGANNAAARIARGEYLVFLNNDILVEPDFLDPLLRPFRDPSVFAVTAHIHMAPKHAGGGEVRETGLVRARFEDGLFVLRHEDLPAPGSPVLGAIPAAQEPIPVVYAGGGSSAWRRDRFFALGAFDRLFRPFYFEDLDVSYRAQKAGWKVLFAPTSHVLHQHRQTNNPRNFPARYIERMFGKNNLLFTWKVVTDQGLLNAHFRRLWRLLMGRGGRQAASAEARAQLPAWFLRAAVQLPELLVKRHRARAGLALSDAEVLGEAARESGVWTRSAVPLPAPLQAGGHVPPKADMLAAPRRLLVVGFAPLPCERAYMLDARGFRTWHLAQALLADGHEVTVVGCRDAAAGVGSSALEPILRFERPHFMYYSADQGVFDEGHFLQQVCDQVQPEAIITVDSHCAWAASRLTTEAPLWADFTSHTMSQAQARAAMEGDAAAAEAWPQERAALARADAFSVVSQRQKYALIGELAAIGRLGPGAYGQELVRYLPNAIENAPYRHAKQVLRGKLVGEDDLVLLWCGGGHRWADADTLFEGVAAAIREEARIKLVFLGGAPGRAAGQIADLPYYRFRRRVEESELADRFLFTGWVPTEDVPNYYFESDMGVSIDRASYETFTGCRYHLLDMLRAGLPVITTLGTEFSEVIRDERLGLTVPPGDSEALKQAILTFARDESLRRRCGERGRQYLFKERTVEQVMVPLRDWAKAPASAPDRGRPRAEAPTGWHPRGRVARFLQVWETQGGRAAVRAIARATVAGLADLVSRAFLLRRATHPWGLDPREPPHATLVIRAGSLNLTREAVERIRERYPAAEITVLTPEPLATETGYETGAPVIPARGAGMVSYQITKGLVRRLHRGDYDTIIVAGEGNRRAELVAILAGLGRRVEIREDGAAHTFWVAPYKPLLLLLRFAAGIVEKLALTFFLGLVWGAIWLEGKVWRLREIWGARPRVPASAGVAPPPQ